MDRLRKAGCGRECVHERVIGGEEGGRECLGGHIEALAPVKSMEALLPGYPVGVERPAEVKEQRIDCRGHQKPIAEVD